MRPARRRVAGIRVEQVHVVTLGKIIDGEPIAREEFVEIPDPSRLLPGRFRLNERNQLGLGNDREKSGKNLQIDAIVLQGEFQLVTERITRPITGSINFSNAITDGVLAMEVAGGDGRLMPIWQDREIIAADQGSIPRGPCGFS